MTKKLELCMIIWLINFLHLPLRISALLPPLNKIDLEDILNFESDSNPSFILTSAPTSVLGDDDDDGRGRKSWLLRLQVPSFGSSQRETLVISLQEQIPSARDFVITETNDKGKSKILRRTLKDLDTKGLVRGFVLSFDPSFAHGRIAKDGSFSGIISFLSNSSSKKQQLAVCTVIPISVVTDFLKSQQFEEDEIKEIIKLHLIRSIKSKRMEKSELVNLSSISFVSCGNEDNKFSTNQIKSPFLSLLKQEQNVKVSHFGPGEKESWKSQLHHFNPRENFRRRRNAPISNATDDEENEKNKTMENLSSSTLNSPASTPDRHKFLTVSFFVDKRILKSHFNNELSELTMAVENYVQIADWTTRAQDFDGDGKSDNVGFKLAEIELGEYQEKNSSTKSQSKEDISSHLRYSKAQEFFDQRPTTGNHAVNVALVPLENPIYLNLPVDDDKKTVYGGCTGCHSQKMMQGLINPKAVRYSSRGEAIRLMLATLHILISALVSTEDDDACVECTDADFGAGDGDKWGPCLVEGSLFDASNIPLNSFKLSQCSLKGGKKCIYSQINNRKLKNGQSCLQTAAEKSFCGNGIVEPGEECDCGTLADCISKSCNCGPRNSLTPCVKLSGPEVNLCEELVKCRGFRFLYETESTKNNGSSLLLQSIPDLLESRIPLSDAQKQMPMNLFLCYQFSVVLVVVNFRLFN